MFRKLLLTATLIGFAIIPATAQSFHAEISYRSFRPFINFQIELGTYDRYQRSTYETAYLKGYMDGVNDAYYNGYRFYDLVHNIRAYEAGYRDGLRDLRMYNRLRGHRFAGHYFTYDDYYSPYYSVQIWLNQLSFTFINAPAHRLPRYWERRVHPRVIRYRTHVHRNKRYYNNFRKQYKHSEKRIRKRARNEQKQFRKRNKRDYERGRSKLNRSQAIQRVRHSQSHKQEVRGRSRVRNQGNEAIQGRSGQRIRSHGNTLPRVKSPSRNRNVERKRGGSKVKKNMPQKRQVRSRSRGGNKERVKRSRNRSSKQKRSRGNSSRSRSKRGGN